VEQKLSARCNPTPVFYDLNKVVNQIEGQMVKIAVAALMLFAAMVPAAANPDFDLGPKVGSAVPDIGTLLDSTSTPRTLKSLMGDKGLVLFFFRAASWCPYCQAQLMDLNGGLKQFEARGYGLAGLSYENPATNAAFIAERGIGYPLLSDPGSKIIDRFALRDPQYKPGSKAYGVPRPIIFILNRSGVIQAKLYEETYTKRPPATLVVQTLDNLKN
jgi:peroxiredoxin